MASEADHRSLDAMTASRPEEKYARAILERRGVGWAAAEIDAWSG